MLQLNREEVARYVGELNTTDLNPLEWWKVHEATFLKLYSQK